MGLLINDRPRGLIKMASLAYDVADAGVTLGGKLKGAVRASVPREVTRSARAAGKWMAERGIKPGRLILGPGLGGFFAARELADGRTIGSVAGENLGFFGAMSGSSAIARRLPKFRGKGALTVIGGIVSGIPTSSMFADVVGKYAPIGRLAKAPAGGGV